LLLIVIIIIIIIIINIIIIMTIVVMHIIEMKNDINIKDNKNLFLIRSMKFTAALYLK